MTQLTDSLFAVEVPSMAFGLMVNNYANESELMYMLSMEDIADDDNTEETLITKKLPPGTWQFLCTTRTCTPNQAQEITGEQLYPSIALAGMCKAKGLDERKNYCLLKKVG